MRFVIGEEGGEYEHRASLPCFPFRACTQLLFPQRRYGTHDSTVILPSGQH